MNRKLLAALRFVVASLLVVGCTPGKHAFLIVQMCLSNEQGVAEFVQEMKTISASENMEFVDNSGKAKRELDAIGYTGRERTDNSPVIHIAVQRDNGMGVTAGNLSLPGYQVALGFSEGSDQVEARRFANVVVKRLEQRWHVETVPSGSGAMPLQDCK